jgi:hypothetical protein
MIEYEKDKIRIKAVEKILEELSIESHLLFRTLGIEHVLHHNPINLLPLAKEEREVLIQLLFIFQFLSTFCSGDTDFMNHWISSENKQLSTTPSELLHSREGLKELFDYIQALNR